LIGQHLLTFAKRLGIDHADIEVLVEVLEVLNLQPRESLEQQDAAELSAGYLRSRYTMASNKAERDYHVQRGKLRAAMRDEWTSPRGKVDEGLSDAVEGSLLEARDERERAVALSDLLRGLYWTVSKRRISLGILLGRRDED
jgi:hypothetical protein